MCGADGEDKLFAGSDSSKLRVGCVRGRGERTLRRSGGVIHFDLRLHGFADVNQAIATNRKSRWIVNGRPFRGRPAPGAYGAQTGAEFAHAERMLRGDENRAVRVDGDVQGLAHFGDSTGAQFAVAHAVGEKDGHRAAAAIGDVDGGAGIDGDVRGAQVGAVVLERKTRLAAGRKFMNEAGGGVGDIDDGFSVAGHRDGLVELAGTIAVGTPSVDIFEGGWRSWSSSCPCRTGTTRKPRNENVGGNEKTKAAAFRNAIHLQGWHAETQLVAAQCRRPFHGDG